MNLQKPETDEDEPFNSRHNSEKENFCLSYCKKSECLKTLMNDEQIKHTISPSIRRHNSEQP